MVVDTAQDTPVSWLASKTVFVCAITLQALINYNKSLRLDLKPILHKNPLNVNAAIWLNTQVIQS